MGIFDPMCDIWSASAWSIGRDLWEFGGALFISSCCPLLSSRVVQFKFVILSPRLVGDVVFHYVASLRLVVSTCWFRQSNGILLGIKPVDLRGSKWSANGVLPNFASGKRRLVFCPSPDRKGAYGSFHLRAWRSSFNKPWVRGIL